MEARIAALTKGIRGYDKRIETPAARHCPDTGILRQVQGVGPVTAPSFVLTVEDPRRFPSSRALGAYVGLHPRCSRSGDEDTELRITKA